MYCNECKTDFKVFYYDRNLSDKDIKFCPKCGKSVVPPKEKYGPTIIFFIIVLIILFAMSFLNYYKSTRNREVSESENVNLIVTDFDSFKEAGEKDETEKLEI